MPAPVFLLLLIPTLSTSSYAPEPHYQWPYVNYTWPSATIYNREVATGAYVKEHNVVSGIKRWRDRLYLAVPRLRSGVPVTLTSIPVEDSSGGPLLEPFPDWRMQELGDCGALQFVQSFEIDPWGRMWLIDNGRVEVRTNRSRSLCPARLLILDLEDHGKILLNYIIPEGVVHSRSVYLNDLVVDHEDGGFAYITDNDRRHPGIVVFSLRQRRAWKVSHPSMRANPEAFEFLVNRTRLTIQSNVDGIALSPASSSGSSEGRLVYYSPLSSYEMFAVPTSALKRGKTSISGGEARRLGRKASQSDGMTMSARGELFFGYLAMGAVCVWNSSDDSSSFAESQRILARDEDILQWPDSFGIDAHGLLWNTAKRQSAIRTGTMDASVANFRIFKTRIGARSYQYYADGSAPEAPPIGEGTLLQKLAENLKRALAHVGRRLMMSRGSR